MLNRRQFVAKSIAFLSLIPFVPHFNLVKEKDVRNQGIAIKTATPIRKSFDMVEGVISFRKENLDHVKIYVLRSSKPFRYAPEDTMENFQDAGLIAIMYEPGKEYWWYDYEKNYAYRIWIRGVDIYVNDEGYDGGYSYATKILK